MKEAKMSWCDLLLGYLRFVFYELRKDFLWFYKGFLFLFFSFLGLWKWIFGLKMGFSQLVMDGVFFVDLGSTQKIKSIVAV